MYDLSIEMGHLLQITDSRNQSAESGNGLAAMVSIAGRSFLLQTIQISSNSPISSISQ
jgi:hypothetical protein